MERMRGGDERERECGGRRRRRVERKGGEGREENMV